MKKGFITGLFSLGLAVWVSAQTPAAVTSAFHHDVPNATATFVQEGGIWQARFVHNGQSVFYAYDPQGIFLYKEHPIQKTDVPAAILTDMEQRFNSEQNVFAGVAKRELPNGNVQYRYQYKNSDRRIHVLYDTDGQIVGRGVSQE